MNKKAALLTIKDVVEVIVGLVLGLVVGIGSIYAFLYAPIWMSQLFNFTIPDDTPGFLVYGSEFMIIASLALAVMIIRYTYLKHKEDLEGIKNKEENSASE